MVKRSIISVLLAFALFVSFAAPTHAVSNSTQGNPATFADGSKLYCDIWLGTGMSFGVAGSTWFVPAGSKKNTSIYNQTSVKISGIGCSLYGLSFSNGDKETYDEMTNTLGQNWAGISGTISTDQAWYFNITGTSKGKAWYDSTTRTSSATVTKWV